MIRVFLRAAVSALLVFAMLGSAQAQTGATVTFYHNDGLGSPVAATNASGDVIWRKTYDPYGREHNSGGSAAASNTIGYTGHRFDKDLDLVYAGARYYDPLIGRFMSVDPAGFQESSPLSFNKYAYTNNNPYKYVDPDGENAVAAFGGLLYESGQFVTGNGFNGSMVLGALFDGYNGTGQEIASAAFDDAITFIPASLIAGALLKSARLARAASKLPVNVLRISEKQFGKKLGKHFSEFGLDPSNPAHRSIFKDMINNIANKADKVVQGSFRGQDGVKFFIKGKDVVVTKLDDEFVTVLKDGINNPSVQRALGQ